MSTSPRTSPRRHRRLPLVLHQVLDYLVGLILVSFSLHVGHGGLLAGAGAALIVVGLVSHGPLGALHVLPARGHAAADLLVVAGLALGPLAPALRPDLTGIVTAEVAAAVLLRVWSLTRYRPRPQAATAGAPASVPAVADPTGLAAAGGGGPAGADEHGAPVTAGADEHGSARPGGVGAGAALAGRLAGLGLRRSRQLAAGRLSEVQRAAPARARHVGRTVGVASRLWRQRQR